MTTFLQVHLLVPYSVSNPNRDEQGRPKTAIVGGVPRLRISSQAYKRALRESTWFALDLAGNMGVRTRKLGEYLMNKLIEEGVDPVIAKTVGLGMAEGVGKADGEDGKSKTVAFFSPFELQSALELARIQAKNPPKVPKVSPDAGDDQPVADEKPAAKKGKGKKKAKSSPELAGLARDFLLKADGAVDIALFGRMLAGLKDLGRDAAAQVNHAITTHRAIVEDDNFTAMDELNREDEAGSGMMGVQSFGSGVYYVNANVDVDQLKRNLAGDEDLAARALEAFVRALASAAPSGKQNSFANRPRAHYIRIEVGNQTPRDLSAAFIKPVSGADHLQASIEALETHVTRLEAAYGAEVTDKLVLDVMNGGASLDEIAAFAARAAKN